MTLLFRKIGVVFTALLLIAASGGYSIYRHYCDCQDTLKTSVFLEIECSHDQGHDVAMSCCSIEDHPSSCCLSGNESTDKVQCHSGDCCQTNILFLKIDDSYTASQEKVSFNVSFVALALYEKDILLRETAVDLDRYFYSDSSPPLTGKRILLEIHQLKLSPELG